MSAVKAYLRSLDDDRLAREGDPARYRMRLDAFFALFDEGTQSLTAPLASQMLDALSLVYGNLPNKATDHVVSRELWPLLMAEVSDPELLRRLVGEDMEHLYRDTERNSENMSNLVVRAALELARIRSESSFLARLFAPEDGRAKELYEFGTEKLRQLKREKYPQPVVRTEVVYQSSPVQYVVPLGNNGR